MKKYFTVLYALLLYFAVAVIMILNYKLEIITFDYAGFDYSASEHIFWLLWILLSAFVVSMILKSEIIGKFFLKGALFWFVYYLLSYNYIILNFINDYILHNVATVGIAEQDFFDIHYFGCVLGTIAGFIITMMKKKRKQVNE